MIALLSCAGFFIAHYMPEADPGYIQVQYGQIRMTTGFWAGITSLAAILLGCYLIFLLIGTMLGIYQKIKQWLRNQTRTKANLHQELIHAVLYENDGKAFMQMQKLVQFLQKKPGSGHEKNEALLSSIVVLLSSKVLTERLFGLEEHKQLLNKLANQWKDSAMIMHQIQLLQAGILIKQHQPARAIKLLETLPAGTAKYRLLLQQLHLEQRWKSIIAIWPQITDQNHRRFWLHIYLQALLTDQQLKKAIKYLHQAIKTGYFPEELLHIFRDLITRLSARQLRYELKFLHQQLNIKKTSVSATGNDRRLNLAMAYLYEHMELWQQAKLFFEYYLTASSDSDKHALFDDAKEHYQKILHIINQRLDSHSPIEHHAPLQGQVTRSSPLQ